MITGDGSLSRCPVCSRTPCPVCSRRAGLAESGFRRLPMCGKPTSLRAAVGDALARAQADGSGAGKADRTEEGSWESTGGGSVASTDGGSLARAAAERGRARMAAARSGRGRGVASTDGGSARAAQVSAASIRRAGARPDRGRAPPDPPVAARSAPTRSCGQDDGTQLAEHRGSAGWAPGRDRGCGRPSTTRRVRNLCGPAAVDRRRKRWAQDVRRVRLASVQSADSCREHRSRSTADRDGSSGRRRSAPPDARESLSRPGPGRGRPADRGGRGAAEGGRLPAGMGRDGPAEDTGGRRERHANAAARGRQAQHLEPAQPGQPGSARRRTAGPAVGESCCATRSPRSLLASSRS